MDRRESRIFNSTKSFKAPEDKINENEKNERNERAKTERSRSPHTKEDVLSRRQSYYDVLREVDVMKLNESIKPLTSQGALSLRINRYRRS